MIVWYFSELNVSCGLSAELWSAGFCHLFGRHLTRNFLFFQFLLLPYKSGTIHPRTILDSILVHFWMHFGHIVGPTWGLGGLGRPRGNWEDTRVAIFHCFQRLGHNKCAFLHRKMQVSKNQQPKKRFCLHICSSPKSSCGLHESAISQFECFQKDVFLQKRQMSFWAWGLHESSILMFFSWKSIQRTSVLRCPVFRDAWAQIDGMQKSE